MKLKLVEPGYENMTGLFGVVEFKDGVSVGDVSERDAVRISASVRTVWEDGTQANPAARLLEMADTGAPQQEQLARGNDDAAPEQTATVEQSETAQTGPAYSVEELEALADEKGIKGIRAIADPLGIKGTSVADLIRKIVDHANGQKVTE